MRMEVRGDKKKMKKAISMGIIGIIVSAMLLASPVLASAGYSKIYGNANEDDTIDMRDTTYIKLVIFGKKPATTFADANNDGKISMLDVGQAKLIILGKEKQLTLVDQADRAVTVPRPIERVVTTSRDSTRVIIGLDACDKIVGVQESPNPSHLPEIAKACGGTLFDRPAVGSFSNLNTELVVSLKPDVVFAYGGSGKYLGIAETVQEQTGIPVVCFRSGFTLEQVNDGIELIGEVLEKEKESEVMISSIEERIDKVREVTSEINEDDKPTVYFAMRGYGIMGGVVSTSNRYEPIEIAGGINVAKDCAGAGSSITVSKEQIIAWDPDIFIIADLGPNYKKVPPADTIYSDQDFQTLRAVKNRKVYPCIYPYASGTPQDRNLVNAFYLAKLFHPDKFEDLDVEKEGNRVHKKFYGGDGLYTWMQENCDLYRWE
jgi:ABC-type Fe3+-hydroxamate transport system substrate-binding protein